VRGQHLAIARRIKSRTATVADWDEINKSFPESHEALWEWLDAEKAAEAAREDGDAREALAGCFKILTGIMKQIQDSAIAQAEMAKALAEGLKHVERLADTLARPRTREGVVETPQGPVRMVITERRQ
jgi:hypothetical protein